MAHPLKTPKARPGRRWAILRVVDNGYGIEEADLNRIFQRFYRAKSQEGTRGTGLGLSIAKDLVELHGGHLKVASAPGEGTAFSILLPLDKYAESGTAQGESRHHEHETGHRADCP